MFWNNVKQHGIKTIMANARFFGVFWNNVKQHGIKTDDERNEKDMGFGIM